MQNLAGVPTAEANEQVAIELQQAGVRLFKLEGEVKREVKATTVGVFYSSPCFIGFQRGWYYWCVRATKPFPLKHILAFNDRWGSEARIRGFSGGIATSQVNEDHLNGDFGNLDSWHIDTQAALDAFVAMAKEVYPPTDSSTGYTSNLIALVVNGEELVEGEIASGEPKKEV